MDQNEPAGHSSDPFFRLATRHRGCAMIPTQEERLAEILTAFDDRPASFRILEMAAAINGLAHRVREAGESESADLLAEQIAFEVLPDFDNKSVDWGTYFGPVMVCG